MPGKAKVEEPVPVDEGEIIAEVVELCERIQNVGKPGKRKDGSAALARLAKVLQYSPRAAPLLAEPPPGREVPSWGRLIKRAAHLLSVDTSPKRADVGHVQTLLRVANSLGGTLLCGAPSEKLLEYALRILKILPAEEKDEKGEAKSGGVASQYRTASKANVGSAT